MKEEKETTPQIFLNDKNFEIPEEGMLGLLALGDVGLKLWRKKRKETEVEASEIPKGGTGEPKTEESADSKTTNPDLPTTN